MKIDNAIFEAFTAHNGQFDKSGAPYIFHPLRVMRTCLKDEDRLTNNIFYVDENAIWDGEDLSVIAVLHDVLEDTPHILRHLNNIQSAALEAITRHHGPNAGETYKEYIVRCCQNPVARIVKYYDLKDNLRPERMSYLSKDEAKGLTKRYEWSIDYINKLSE